ncbi:MAG: hypothetical protein GF331_26175, partial [Chitinivibrionales bacterium]|nr:hypothetical protein [Chitinivibrionales bacterium]
VFSIANTGNHTLLIQGARTDGRWIAFDNFQVCSVDSLVESGFGSGQAIGQPADDGFVERCNNQSVYCRTFGLQLIAYEAGWSVGGDFTQLPIQNWTKLMDPRCTQTNNRAQAIWDESGSFMNVWGVYTYWPSYDFTNSADYPHMQSFTDIANTLREEPTHGKLMPGTLYPGERAWRDGGVSETELANPGDWVSWMFTIGDIAQYDIEVAATAGGALKVCVDGTELGTLANSGDGLGNPMSMVLTRGAHAVRIENTGAASVTIDSVVIGSTPVSIRPDRIVMHNELTPSFGITTTGWAATPTTAAAAPSPTVPRPDRQHPSKRPEEPVTQAPSVTPMVIAMPPAPKEEQGFDRPPEAVRGDNLAPQQIPGPDYTAADMRWPAPRDALTVAEVTASSSTDVNSADNTLDRDLRSRWTPSASNASITYDLGNSRAVDGVTVVWYSLRSSRTACRVETSADGMQYREVWEGTLKGRGTNTEAVSFGVHDARFVKISLDSRKGRGASLYEVAVLGDGSLAAR